MTTASGLEEHPDVETLASFAEGRLSGTRRTAVIDHLDGCEECMIEVALAMKRIPEERAGRVASPVRRLALVAAAVAAGLVLILWPLVSAYRERARSPMARLIAAAPRSQRPLEPRMTGGFAWAAYRGGARAAAAEVDPAQMKLTGIAGELVEQAARERTPESRHAAAVAMLLAQQPQFAVEQLDAVARGGTDAKAWSDLAAARYAMAADRRRPSLYVEALGAADEALRIDPRLPEALFNRALILQRMGLPGEARRAWQRYLEVDASSPWAAEARARLAELPATTTSSSFERDRPLLERAAARGDLAQVRDLLTLHAARARAFAETEYLAAWGEAELRRLGAGGAADAHAAEASRWLAMARTIGAVLASSRGDLLLRDAVAAIDAAAPEVRRRLASGHVAYRHARRTYSRHDAVAGRQELLRAAEVLGRAGGPLSLMARHYAASALLASHRIADARRELETLAAEADSAYVTLRAHVDWELARTFVLDGDAAAAVPILRRGAALFRRAGDRVGEAFVESMLASALTAKGDGDEAWEARTRAFHALSREGDSQLLMASLAAAKRAELLAGRRGAALALSRLEALRGRAGARAVDVVDALVYRALLESAAGNGAEALAAAREAADVARGIEDPAVSGHVAAKVASASGAALAVSDPRAALEPLTRAIEFYRRHDLPFALPEPLLLRARCAIRGGDEEAAWRDLNDGIALLERHREVHASAMFGSGALQATEALFHEAIALALARGDEATAFAMAERSRGASLSIAELQRRLAGSGALVVEAVALPDQLVVFAVGERQATTWRRALSRDALAALARTSAIENGTDGAAALYDALIRPIEPAVAAARQLLFVPDPVLDGVPFGALYDRRRKTYLVERIPVAIAMSGGSLERSGPAPRGRMLTAAALLSGGYDWQKGLPAAADEIRDVLERYPRSRELPRGASALAALRAVDADVLHVAGHTNEEPGGGDRVLVLTTPARGAERVSWATIAAARPIAPPVVVLAACETLRRPASPLTHTPSLGAAFAAAGASDVIGTLARIADRDARALFTAIHTELAAGAGAAEAVRTAQRQAIEGNGPPAWRAVAVLTRRIPAHSR